MILIWLHFHHNQNLLNILLLLLGRLRKVFEKNSNHVVPSSGLVSQYFQTRNKTLPIKFMSYSKHKTEFTVKIDSTEWNSERSIPVSQSAGQVGTEATFDVSYEPTSLGTKSTIMTISSPSGGDYTFPLVGKCLAPNPQG